MSGRKWRRATIRLRCACPTRSWWCDVFIEPGTAYRREPDGSALCRPCAGEALP